MLLFLTFSALCEDGSRLWLRYNAAPNPATVTSNVDTPTTRLAVEELRTYWLGGPIELAVTANHPTITSPDGYTLTGSSASGITLEGSTDAGVLYGAFHLLRLQATGASLTDLSLTESPKYKRRILDHWDNLDGSITRGYAGHSIWKWDELPDVVSPRYAAYARANAAIGINGAVLTNVNASPKILTALMLRKVTAIADVLRPYHISTYLAINFASPQKIGGLSTSDPLDPDVRQWWKDKADEIYSLIPDFGGFLVKASSEGEPGPGDFGRSHLDGANMLADALSPHGGIVMWRAFVYTSNDNDRAKQAYEEFIQFDGKFAANVLIQAKNGPLDFQPREPFSPLFGGMQKTPVMVEFQITQEYLGQANGSVFLPALEHEVLNADTYARGEGSTVGRATDGSLFGHEISAIAGVSNIGELPNWCGHHLLQANWYGFGRLAWNYETSPGDIVREWLRLTFSRDAQFVEPMADIMIRSREAVVDYMMPLGLHFGGAWNHHYGPEPWCSIPGARPDWLPSYYHQARADGIGFDRTSKGSNMVSQYFPPLRQQYNDLDTCDEKLLLWFHHVPWQHRMKSGKSLWDELCIHYQHGVEEIREFQKVWDRLKKFVDPDRFAEVQRKLRLQENDALWWRDACVLYFQTFSKLPIPYDLERPINNLDELQQIHYPWIDHN